MLTGFFFRGLAKGVVSNADERNLPEPWTTTSRALKQWRRPDGLGTIPKVGKNSKKGEKGAQHFDLYLVQVTVKRKFLLAHQRRILPCEDYFFWARDGFSI
jgi:hypothetical protein